MIGTHTLNGVMEEMKKLNPKTDHAEWADFKLHLMRASIKAKKHGSCGFRWNIIAYSDNSYCFCSPVIK